MFSHLPKLLTYFFLKKKISLFLDSKTNPKAISEAMVHLDSFLQSIHSDMALSLRITSSRVVKRIVKRGLVRFLETYKSFYQEISSNEHVYFILKFIIHIFHSIQRIY